MSPEGNTNSSAGGGPSREPYKPESPEEYGEIVRETGEFQDPGAAFRAALEVEPLVYMTAEPGEGPSAAHTLPGDAFPVDQVMGRPDAYGEGPPIDSVRDQMLPAPEPPIAPASEASIDPMQALRDSGKWGLGELLRDTRPPEPDASDLDPRVSVRFGGGISDATLPVVGETHDAVPDDASPVDQVMGRPDAHDPVTELVTRTAGSAERLAEAMRALPIQAQVAVAVAAVAVIAVTVATIGGGSASQAVPSPASTPAAAASPVVLINLQPFQAATATPRSARTPSPVGAAIDVTAYYTFSGRNCPADVRSREHHVSTQTIYNPAPGLTEITNFGSITFSKFCTPTLVVQGARQSALAPGLIFFPRTTFEMKETKAANCADPSQRECTIEVSMFVTNEGQ
jgi:hypothetical protein